MIAKSPEPKDYYWTADHIQQTCDQLSLCPSCFNTLLRYGYIHSHPIDRFNSKPPKPNKLNPITIEDREKLIIQVKQTTRAPIHVCEELLNRHNNDWEAALEDYNNITAQEAMALRRELGTSDPITLCRAALYMATNHTVDEAREWIKQYKLDYLPNDSTRESEPEKSAVQQYEDTKAFAKQTGAPLDVCKLALANSQDNLELALIDYNIITAQQVTALSKETGESETICRAALYVNGGIAQKATQWLTGWSLGYSAPANCPLGTELPTEVDKTFEKPLVFLNEKSTRCTKTEPTMPEIDLQPGDLVDQAELKKFNTAIRDKIREARDLMTSRQLMTVQHVTKPLDEALNTLDDLYQAALDLVLAPNNHAPNSNTE